MPPVATRTPMKTSITNVQRIGALDEVHGTTTPEAVKHLKYADLGAEEPESGEDAAPAGGAALGKHQVLRQWAVRAAPGALPLRKQPAQKRCVPDLGEEASPTLDHYLYSPPREPIIIPSLSSWNRLEDSIGITENLAPHLLS